MPEPVLQQTGEYFKRKGVFLKGATAGELGDGFAADLPAGGVRPSQVA
ncbi:MAG: hypothetical protein NT047_02290 [Deltaproteobacteria bacterium]|nr:hypothetical protein [Deltaproteobacteria bacterium]